MEKISIGDLSIGDWVYHDDIVFGREIAKVHRLNKDKNGETIGITVYRSDGAFGIVGYIWTSSAHGDLHPIHLTPEILEKNGFVKTWGRWYDSDTLMEFEQYKDGWSRTINGGEYSVYFIKYVHQLQHALRLAGVGKEIEV